MVSLKRARSTEPQPAHLIIERQPEESLADWQRTIEELSSADSLAVTINADGTAGLVWKQAGPTA